MSTTSVHGRGGTVADGVICLAASSGEPQPQHDGSDPVRDLSTSPKSRRVHMHGKDGAHIHGPTRRVSCRCRRIPLTPAMHAWLHTHTAREQLHARRCSTRSRSGHGSSAPERTRGHECTGPHNHSRGAAHRSGEVRSCCNAGDRSSDERKARGSYDTRDIAGRGLER